MNSKKAYNKIDEGNIRFVNSRQINRNTNVSDNELFVDAQDSFAVILTGTDSCIGVSEIIDTKLGDIRN